MSTPPVEPAAPAAPAAPAVPPVAPAVPPAAPAAPAIPPAPAAPAVPPTPPAAPAVPLAPAVPPAPAAAIEYTDFTAPEGVTLDTDLVTAFKGVAKDLKLPQGDAQKVIDAVAPVMAARQTAAFQATKDGWLKTVRADAEYSDGPDVAVDKNVKLGQTLAVAKLAMTTHFDPEFVTFLETTGLGNHPSMVKGLFKLGKVLAPDGVHIEGQPRVGPKSMYPNSNHNA